MPSWLTVLVASALLSACAGAQTLSPDVKQFLKVDSPTVALTHVRVIDGTGAPARDDQTVVMSDGKISSITDSASPAPKDAKVLELQVTQLFRG
jgi:imidazolonepropionase-like amidohydrolase